MTAKPKRPRDANQLAKSIVDLATGAIESVQLETNIKSAKAGVKGGKARATSLSAEERKEIAIKAAKGRWEKR